MYRLFGIAWRVLHHMSQLFAKTDLFFHDLSHSCYKLSNRAFEARMKQFNR